MEALTSSLRSERRTERLAAELRMWPMRVEDVAVGVSHDLSGVELHDASRTLDVDGQPGFAAAIGIEELRPGVALLDGLAVGGDCGVVVDMDYRLDEVPLLIGNTLKKPYSCSIGTNTSNSHGAAAQTSVSVKVLVKSNVPRSTGAATAWAARHSVDALITAETVANARGGPAFRLMLPRWLMSRPGSADTRRLDARRPTTARGGDLTLPRAGEGGQPCATSERNRAPLVGSRQPSGSSSFDAIRPESPRPRITRAAALACQEHSAAAKRGVPVGMTHTARHGRGR